MVDEPPDIGANDVVRFLLEMGALGAFALWGWRTHAGVARWAWAVGLTLGVMLVWATFRVPGDDSRAPTGDPVEPIVAVPGPVRLALELVLFGAATAALAVVGNAATAGLFAALVVAHYVLARERVRWLLGA